MKINKDRVNFVTGGFGNVYRHKDEIDKLIFIEHPQVK